MRSFSHSLAVYIRPINLHTRTHTPMHRGDWRDEIWIRVFWILFIRRCFSDAPSPSLLDVYILHKYVSRSFHFYIACCFKLFLFFCSLFLSLFRRSVLIVWRSVFSAKGKTDRDNPLRSGLKHNRFWIIIVCTNCTRCDWNTIEEWLTVKMSAWNNSWKYTTHISDIILSIYIIVCIWWTDEYTALCIHFVCSIFSVLFLIFVFFLLWFKFVYDRISQWLLLLLLLLLQFYKYLSEFKFSLTTSCKTSEPRNRCMKSNPTTIIITKNNINSKEGEGTNVYGLFK